MSTQSQVAESAVAESPTAASPVAESPTTARERIAALLRDDILDGRLGPEVPLRTEALVARFGVSNSPLREAFFQLAAEGLVEIKPNRGVIVTSVTKDGSADLIRITSLLYDALNQWTVPLLDEATAGTLERVTTDFDLALRSGDRRGAVLDGERFGRTILDTCWSTELVRAIDAVRPRITRLNRILADDSTLESLAVVHHEILAAAGSTDLDGVEAAMASYWDALGRAVATSSRVAP